MRTTLVLAFTIIFCLTALGQSGNGEYTLVVEGFDWGPATSKVILHVSDTISEANPSNYAIEVKRSSDCLAEDSPRTKGKLDVVTAYVSDEVGNRKENGQHITLHVGVGPHIQIGSPILFFFSEGCRGNQWTDYQLTISNTETDDVWNTESNRIIPMVDNFDLTGKFSHEDIKLTYASFAPESDGSKKPLIIWLHGGGEGGTDPSIVLLANRATNYASPEIQELFGGAYVLAPQSPTFWMQNADGQYTRGDTDDIYNEALMALFKQFISENPDIDPNRIYVGGCSNGGYMTQKLMLLNPDFFAAGFPSALAFEAKNLSKKDLEVLAGQSIWYIHSKDDPVTPAATTVIPTYEKLMDVGAKDIHLSLYDHVIDLYDVFGGENYHLNGHFSWIYSHRNHPRKVINGKELSVMEWMANKSL